MNSVLWISLIGAGLVIVGLMILWFMMYFLVRLTATKPIKEKDTLETDAGRELPETADEGKYRAAAAAVSIALLRMRNSSAARKPTSSMSPWQAAHRHSQLHNRPHPVVSKGKMK